MNLLLDTHVFIWLELAPQKLSQAAMDACSDINNKLYLSVASVWEMQIKSQLNKFGFTVDIPLMIDTQCNENGLQVLPITLAHIYQHETLDNHHRDPFDRLIIAQAIKENMTLVSADGVFDSYDVPLLR